MAYVAADSLHFGRLINFDLQLVFPFGGQDAISGLKELRGLALAPPGSRGEGGSASDLPRRPFHASRCSSFHHPPLLLPSHQHPLPSALPGQAPTPPGTSLPTPRPARLVLLGAVPSWLETSLSPRPTQSAPTHSPASSPQPQRSSGLRALQLRNLRATPPTSPVSPSAPPPRRDHSGVPGRALLPRALRATTPTGPPCPQPRPPRRRGLRRVPGRARSYPELFAPRLPQAPPALDPAFSSSHYFAGQDAQPLPSAFPRAVPGLALPTLPQLSCIPGARRTQGIRPPASTHAQGPPLLVPNPRPSGRLPGARPRL